MDPIRRPPTLDRRAFVRDLAGVGLPAVAIAVLSGCNRLPFQMPQPRVARIGYLNSTLDPGTGNLDAFRQGMRDSGWIEGQNLMVDIRWAEDHPDRYPALAAELVALKPEAVVCGQIAGVQALMRASDALPIVMANVSDPVGSGVIASLARPGGNVTGVSTYPPGGIGAKRFGLLKEIVPGLSLVAVVFEKGNPAGVNELQEIQDAARQAGVEAQAVGVASPDELIGALNSALVSRPEALMEASGGAIINGRRKDIVDFANSHGLPSIGNSMWADAGFLVAYGPVPLIGYRRAAYYVDRILRGARPADLPVEQPTTFDLVVNQTTAQALGITFPPDVAAQVTEWIQ